MTMATEAEEGGGGGGRWAAIARKDAAVEQKLDIPSLLCTAGLKTVVVDANAIIGGGIKLLGLADQYFTVKEVLQEVRDPASRFHLATLPVTIRCLDPSDESLTKVMQFARATGDLQALSEVDLKLIALTYTLEAQVHGTDHIRSRPPPLLVTASNKGYRPKDPPGWGNVANPGEWEGIEEDDEEANTGSRILGVKSLSLDEPDVGESYQAGEVDNVNEPAQKTSDDGESKSEENVLAGAEGSTAVISQPAEEISSTTVDIKTTAVQGGQGVQKDETTVSGSPYVEGKILVARGVDASKGEVDVNGDDWERALSRSTKRQYMKRAQRRAAREQLEASLATDGSHEVEKGGQEVAKSLEDSREQGSTQGAVSRPDLSSGAEDARREAQLPERSSDHYDESAELGDSGFSEDGAESVDYQSTSGDTLSNTDVSSSVMESEQSWSVTPLWTSSIACMTADYAMQNVILQMGLRLLSTSGQHIKELNKWVLKCQACGTVTNESGRLFCPKCGNGGTLFKVAISVGPNGNVHAGRNRRPILRGTRYSLPLPKGGREGASKNPILREDQLPAKPRKVKKPEFEAFSSADVVFSVAHERKGQKGAAVKSAAAIYAGRRNPNERRKIAK